jgi:hypothetical protein
VVSHPRFYCVYRDFKLTIIYDAPEGSLEVANLVLNAFARRCMFQPFDPNKMEWLNQILVQIVDELVREDRIVYNALSESWDVGLIEKVMNS